MIINYVSYLNETLLIVLYSHSFLEVGVIATQLVSQSVKGLDIKVTLGSWTGENILL